MALELVSLDDTLISKCLAPLPPAQAAGLTDHIWTVKELLTIVPVPLAINT